VKDHTRQPFRRIAGQQEQPGPDVEEEQDVTGDAEAIKIVRTKTHPLKPMTAEEAALQMELLGHDFFVFFNGNSRQVEVVYRRRDGGYGLIEPVTG